VGGSGPALGPDDRVTATTRPASSSRKPKADQDDGALRNMTDITISTEQLRTLTEKLDAMELTYDERATLNAVFAAAGKATAEDRYEVSGYWCGRGNGTAVRPGLERGSFASFSWGASSPGSVEILCRKAGGM